MGVVWVYSHFSVLGYISIFYMPFKDGSVEQWFEFAAGGSDRRWNSNVLIYCTVICHMYAFFSNILTVKGIQCFVHLYCNI